MSRIYNAVVFFGVKIQIKVSGFDEVSKLFSGTHPLTEKVVAAELDVYCRSMVNYIHYEDDDAFLFIGKRIANADVDRPMSDFDEAAINPLIIKNVMQSLSKLGYSEKPLFHLVCDHSD